MCKQSLKSGHHVHPLFVTWGKTFDIQQAMPKIGIHAPNDLIHKNRFLFPTRSPVETLNESSPYQKDVKVPHPPTGVLVQNQDGWQREVFWEGPKHNSGRPESVNSLAHDHGRIADVHRPARRQKTRAILVWPRQRVVPNGRTAELKVWPNSAKVHFGRSELVYR